MQGNKKRINISGPVKSFFQFRPNLWIIITTIIVLVCASLIFLKKQDLKIFPESSNFNIGFYNDSASGGSSVIEQHNVSDTAIDLTFDLRKGFMNPYVGINIAAKDNRTISIRPYNQIEFEIKGKDIKNLMVFLYTKNVNAGIDSAIHEICFWDNLEITSQRKQYDLRLDQFEVPDWWFEMYKLSPSKKILPDWQHVLRIDFVNGSTPVSDTKRSISIYSIRFLRNDQRGIIVMSIAELSIIFVLLALQFLRNRTREKIKPVTITYKPVYVEEDKTQGTGFLDYIHSNFQDNDMNLEMVSGNTGTSQRRIANTIMEQFDCNFKTYVNRIRINESKRLLQELGLTIGEIAYKVGFSSPNHFNRVFKSMVGMSPSQFKETTK